MKLFSYFRSIQIRSTFICLWRRLANCFDFIAALPAEKAFTSVPGSLLNESEVLITIKGDKLYEIAARYFDKNILSYRDRFYKEITFEQILLSGNQIKYVRSLALVRTFTELL